MKNYQEAEKIELVFSGNDYFDVLERIIDESKSTLHLQTYIFESDTTGLKIAEALKRAAARGVQVYMLVDAYGCYPFSKKTEKELLGAGVHFRLYSPLFSSESVYFSRRLHHKIIVADKNVALTGGINIANKYSGNDNESAWLDYAVLTRGKVCEYLQLVCEMFYEKKSSGRLTHYEKSLGQTGSNLQRPVRFRRNDWIKGKNEIYKSYTEAVSGAKFSITIVASYFLPGSAFRKLLSSAAKRGVEINIILAGKSDIPSLRRAEHYMYGYYLKNKINIYEWTNSVMHGKAMIVDNSWATVGSYNLNLLSRYISVELNTDIADKNFVNIFALHLRDIMKNNCNVIDLKKTVGKDKAFNKFRMWMAYHFYRWLMRAALGGKKNKTTKK